MKYLMGIDNGGTFSKAAIFDENGTQISVASVPTVTITPKPGYTERDMNELWEVNAEAVRLSIEKSGIDLDLQFRGPSPQTGEAVAQGVPVGSAPFAQGLLRLPDRFADAP